MDLVYIGSSKKLVDLCFVKGSYYEIREENELKEVINDEARENSLRFRFSQDFLGPDYRHLLIPCNPSHEILLEKRISELPMSNGAWEEQEKFLSRPLIKVPEGKGDIRGYQSGKRSCLVLDQQKCYRLKGCGNLDQGFTLMRLFEEGLTQEQADKLKIRDINSVQIRGSHYLHTAKRELYMNTLIADIMAKQGIMSANKSLGFWVYDSQFARSLQENRQIQIQNEMPRVTKICCVFETIGDRRALTHLIQGASIMLKLLIHKTRHLVDLSGPENFYATHSRLEKQFSGEEIFSTTPIFFEEYLLSPSDFEVYENLKAYFNSEKFNPKIDNLYGVFTQKTNIFVTREQREILLQQRKPLKPQKPEEAQQKFCEQEDLKQGEVVEALDLQKNLRTEPEKKESENQDPQFQQESEIKGLKSQTEQKEGEKPLGEEFKVGFEYLEKQFNGSYEPEKAWEVFNKISFIYSRVGYEIGKIFRILADHDISWGYYSDHDPSSIHQNAHPNNLVVIPESFGSENLLAPLDFDLAFTQATFIDIEYERESYGQNSRAIFQSSQEAARFYLEMMLAGEEDLMQNFAFQTKSNQKFSDFSRADEQLYKKILVILRDTQKIAYLRGLRLQEDEEVPIQIKGNASLHEFIRVLLTLTEDCIG